jgi:hypothetical protein
LYLLEEIQWHKTVQYNEFMFVALNRVQLTERARLVRICLEEADTRFNELLLLMWKMDHIAILLCHICEDP